MVTELGPLLFFMLKYIKAGVADLAIQKKKGSGSDRRNKPDPDQNQIDSIYLQTLL